MKKKRKWKRKKRGEKNEKDCCLISDYRHCDWISDWLLVL